MLDAIDESGLLRLLDGDCSPDEAARLRAWVAAEPGRGQLLDELRAVWCVTGAPRDWNVAGARERLQRARFPVRSVISLRGVETRQWVAWGLKVAVLAAVVLAGAAAWQLLPRVYGPWEYVTSPGQRSQVALLDGTRVLLGVDSRLRVPRDYGVARRVVELEGEAYFVVQHDAVRPFVVRAAHGTAEDLGTEFDVRAYRGEHVQVVVVAGAVALRAGTGSAALTLRPRDRGVIDALGVATRTADVPVEDYVAWTTGVLMFNDTPLRSGLLQLGRWYDLHVALSDSSLDERRLTLSFGRESIEEALVTIARTLDVDVTRVGKSVCFSPQPVTASRPQSSEPTYVPQGTLGDEVHREGAHPRAADAHAWLCPEP